MKLCSGTPPRLGAHFAGRFQEPLAIEIILEHRLAPIPATHHLMDRPEIFHPRLARQVRIVLSRPARPITPSRRLTNAASLAGSFA